MFNISTMFIVGGLMGLVMTSCGITIDTWQYWAAVVLTAIANVVGYFDGKIKWTTNSN